MGKPVIAVQIKNEIKRQVKVLVVLSDWFTVSTLIFKLPIIYLKSKTMILAIIITWTVFAAFFLMFNYGAHGGSVTSKKETISNKKAA